MPLKVQLNENQEHLLIITATELITSLSESKRIGSVKTCAFPFINRETDDQFQVQVIVTRHKKNFVEAFTIEETTSA